MRSCSEENHSQPLVVSLEDGSACMTPELRDAPQNELFMFLVGAVGQMVPAPPAGRACFRADRSQKRAAKYCGLVAGALCCPEHLSFHSLEIHLIAQMNPL